MNRDVGQQEFKFWPHPPHENFLEVPTENLILSVIVVTEDKAFPTPETMKNVIRPCSVRHVNIAEMVDDILVPDYRVPVLNHFLIHFLDGLKPIASKEFTFTVGKLENVSMVEVSIRGYKDIPSG